jgi:hypothetical protein
MDTNKHECEILYPLSPALAGERVRERGTKRRAESNT